MNKRIIPVLLIMLLLIGCTESNILAASIQEAMSETNIKFKAVNYQEETEDGVLLFYETFDQKGLQLGYLRKTSRGYKWVIGGGSAEPIPPGLEAWTRIDNSLSYLAWTRIDDRLSYLYGVLIDSRIAKIQVRDAGGNIEEPPIIETENGDLIWFVKKSNSDKGTIPGVTEYVQVIYLY